MSSDRHSNDTVEQKQEKGDLERDTELEASLPSVEQDETATDAFTPLAPLGVDADALADMQTYSNLQEKRKKAKRKKIITIIIVCVLVLVLLIAGSIWLLGSMTAESAEDMAPQTASVERGLFLDEVSASGKLKPISSVIATPEVEGIVGEVWVSEGDVVTAGQGLYTVVNNELDKEVSSAEQAVNEAYNGVLQAQISLDDAYRAKQQGSQGAADAGESFDAGQADSAIRQAEIALSSAWSTYSSAQVAYDDAVARAEKRTVTSSIDGNVVAVNIEPGKSLGGAGGSATSVPVQIANLSSMLVSVEVNEIDILKVSVDQTANLTFSAIPDLQLTGTVNRIATVNTGASGEGEAGASGTVTYAVDILIQTPDPRLKPGMTAKATVEAQRIEDTLMVPISAVTTTSATEGTVLLVDPENPDVPKECKVEILASNGLYMAIKGALSEGDEILIVGDSDSLGIGAGSDDVSGSSTTEVVTVG